MAGLFVLCCSVLIAAVAATRVTPCPGSSIDQASLWEDVQLPSCEKLPCVLRKGTYQNYSIAFTPETDIADIQIRTLLKNSGSTYQIGKPISICDKLQTAGGKETTCPLQAGVKYIHKDSFHVNWTYPNGLHALRWSLIDGEKDIMCFEGSIKIKRKNLKKMKASHV